MNRLSCLSPELSLMNKFYKLSNCVLCHVYHYCCPVQSGSPNMCLPVNVFWLLPKHKLCVAASSTTDRYFPFLFFCPLVIYGVWWWSMVVLYGGDLWCSLVVCGGAPVVTQCGGNCALVLSGSHNTLAYCCKHVAPHKVCYTITSRNNPWAEIVQRC